MENCDISPEEFLEKWQNSMLAKERVIDVREEPEWNYYHLEGSLLIPMNTIPGRLGEIPDDRTVYIICAHGSRSVMVCEYLIRQGRSNLRNVAGGMAAVAGLQGFDY
jgi:rhodanese-related sulfurtransferase